MTIARSNEIWDTHQFDSSVACSYRLMDSPSRSVP